MTIDIERLHYHQRQYLSAADLEAQQRYHRDMRRRHNVGHHTWGIVTGLLLVEKPNECDPSAVDVFMTPGFAVDGFGREIVVFEPVKIDSALFDSFLNLQHRSVWIEYDQRNAAYAKTGFQVCRGDDFARVEETFRLVIEPAPPTHDPVDLAGKPTAPPATPDDESVPEQEFPDDADQPLWLVPLGYVLWDGVHSKFVPAVPEKAVAGRHYAGAVCEQIFGPAGKLFLADRNSHHPLPADPKLPGYAGLAAEVEGSLQVDRLLVAKQDEQIHGGRLYFENKDGGDDAVPFWLQRLPGPITPGSADLRVHIGDAKIGEATAIDTRLTVGNFEANGKDEAVIFAVRGDNVVEIPTGVLEFDKKLRQMINLWTTFDGHPVHGIGVQHNVTYFRSSSEFCWFQNGAHTDAQADPGGGVLELRLNPGGLFFGRVTQQMLNLWGAEYGIGIQDSTEYFRSGADFCWFRKGVHSDTSSDPGGGFLAMKLDHDSNLSVSGGLLAGGNVGFGGSLSVGGNLRVNGDQDLIKIRTFTLNIQNGPGDKPATWSVPHPGEFSKIYAKFVMLQGYNIFGLVGSAFGHLAHAGAIPQNTFVRITGGDDNSTSGDCFCSESSDFEDDNAVLFTVVVFGKGVM
jgi:hypothetical protein